MKLDPTVFALPHVKAMHAYVPGLQPTEPDWVKINTNENPYPPSPEVAKAIREALEQGAGQLRLYPNPSSGPLREAVAGFHNVPAEQVIIGNGCDDILNLLMRVFCSPEKPMGMMKPSYSLYSVLSDIQAGQVLTVEFDESMTLDIEAIANLGANIFFLTNPNAPVGVHFSNADLRNLLDRFEGILVVDETYAPFAQEDAVSLLDEYPHLVIARSFSKAYALAGMRVGYALASAEIIGLLDCVRDSYNLDHLAQQAAAAAIKDHDYFESIRDKIIKQREHSRAEFEKLGWFVYPSEANFLFVKPADLAGRSGPAVANSLFQFLTDQKILVRYFPKHPLTHAFLRISVGSPQEMQRLMEVIEVWLKNQNGSQK